MIAFSNTDKPDDPTSGSAGHSDLDEVCNRLEIGWIEVVLISGWAIMFFCVKLNLVDLKSLLVASSGEATLLPLICYSFIHQTWTQLFWSLAILVCFGQVARACLSMAQAMRVYLVGIIAGGSVYLTISRQFDLPDQLLAGAATGLVALLGASAAIAPNQRVSVLGDATRRSLHRLFVRNKDEMVISPIWILVVVTMLIVGMVRSLGFILTAQLDIFVYAMFPLRTKWMLAIWLGMRGIALLSQTFVLRTEISGETITIIATAVIACAYGILERGFRWLRVGDAASEDV